MSTIACDILGNYFGCGFPVNSYSLPNNAHVPVICNTQRLLPTVHVYMYVRAISDPEWTEKQGVVLDYLAAHARARLNPSKLYANGSFAIRAVKPGFSAEQRKHYEGKYKRGTYVKYCSCMRTASYNPVNKVQHFA